MSFQRNVGLALTTPGGKVAWIIAYIVGLFLTVAIIQAVVVGALGWPYWVYLICCGLSGIPLAHFLLTLPTRWKKDAEFYLQQKELDKLIRGE